MAGEKPDVLMVGAREARDDEGLRGQGDAPSSGSTPRTRPPSSRNGRQDPRDRDRLYRQQSRRKPSEAVSQARAGFELRRRLRPYRRQMGRRARHHRHQHAGVLNEEVADTALGLLLCTVREFPQSERFLRAGKWPQGQYPLTKATLRDRTVGMVGMGRIGKASRGGSRHSACRSSITAATRSPA